LRYYLYVLTTVWLVMAIMFVLWGLIADGPGLVVIVPVVAIVTIAGIVSVWSQR
jgi:hypothetical protein